MSPAPDSTSLETSTRKPRNEPDLHLLGRVARSASEEAAVHRLEWRLFFEPQLRATALTAIQDWRSRTPRALLLAVLAVGVLTCGMAHADSPLSNGVRIFGGIDTEAAAHATDAASVALLEHYLRHDESEPCPFPEECRSADRGPKLRSEQSASGHVAKGDHQRTGR